MLPLCPGWNSRNFGLSQGTPLRSRSLQTGQESQIKEIFIMPGSNYEPAEGEAPNEHQRALCVSVPRGWRGFRRSENIWGEWMWP